MLDDGIVRTLWLTLDELKATAHLHRSPIVLQSVQDYLAGQRFDLGLIQADSSIYTVPEPTLSTQDLLTTLQNAPAP